MQTPWGELPVSDAHIHFFSHRFLSLLAGQKGGGATAETVCVELGWPCPSADPAALAQQWVKELDRNGVKSASLIASLPGDEGSVAAALAAAPGRFFGYFLTNPLAEGALAAAERAFAAGLRGLALFPAMHRYSVCDDRLTPFFELAAATPKALVFVHCGVLSVGIRKKLSLASPFDLRYSNPADLHPIALRYPKLPFVVPHFGAGYFREALMLGDLCQNVYLDTSSTNGWIKYQAAKMTLADVFERALAVVGPRRLLFGTDSSYFPRGWHRAILEQQTAALLQVGIAQNEAGLILSGNLEGLLG